MVRKLAGCATRPQLKTLGEAIPAARNARCSSSRNRPRRRNRSSTQQMPASATACWGSLGRSMIRTSPTANPAKTSADQAVAMKRSLAKDCSRYASLAARYDWWKSAPTLARDDPLRPAGPVLVDVGNRFGGSLRPAVREELRDDVLWPLRLAAAASHAQRGGDRRARGLARRRAVVAAARTDLLGFPPIVD